MNINIRNRQICEALKLGYKANLAYDFKRRRWLCKTKCWQCHWCFKFGRAKAVCVLSFLPCNQHDNACKYFEKGKAVTI